MDFDKLTIKAQEVVRKAQQLAMENEHQAIECGHLLKGIMQVDENIIPHVFLNNYDGFYDRFLADLPYKKEYAIPKNILELDRFSNALDLLSASKEVIKFLFSFGFTGGFPDRFDWLFIC